jgi:hypothetical protein
MSLLQKKGVVIGVHIWILSAFTIILFIHCSSSHCLQLLSSMGSSPIKFALPASDNSFYQSHASRESAKPEPSREVDQFPVLSRSSGSSLST